MKKPSQDKDNFDFTERWVSEHLPSDMSITTEHLYNDFTDRLNTLEVDKADMPSRSAFLSRMHKMPLLNTERVLDYNCLGKKVWQTAWFKVEIVKEVEPIKMSKNYPKVCDILMRSKRGIQSWFS